MFHLNGLDWSVKADAAKVLIKTCADVQQLVAKQSCVVRTSLHVMAD